MIMETKWSRSHNIEISFDDICRNVVSRKYSENLQFYFRLVFDASRFRYIMVDIFYRWVTVAGQ
eukprot:TRINITY_DN1583_c0_g1_i1.p3 TRINITY_DN1583_c0_g1~~TRINITY_DN1583_c0_g1_i1.p3  ORF type:complete len:64 (-),score=2.65 TRINITY_DN1583_c0_g1_i1:88-279(-)